MKKLFLMVFLPLSAFAQQGLIPAFDLESNDIALTRLAQPGTPFDKVGRRFALLGFESGTFEAWAYPLKLVRSCELSFFIGSSTEPIRARDIVRHITATPEATTLTYTYQSFTIKSIFITPVEEPGALILLEVNATEPLTIVCSFLPVLQPMWPAGLGGQSASWLDDIKAYQISEPTRRNTAYIGSPAASGISYTPAHMLSDVPNQFKIEIRNPNDVRGKYIPIFLAGGKGSRESVKTTYMNLMKNPEALYRRTAEHYRTLREKSLQVETPNRLINLALEWAKVAYDNLMVRNPDLGYGMVAGLGGSGTGGRPGFGWFFGGDTYINSFSMNSYGEFETVRDALMFTQNFQRGDGKMPHEVSQGAGYIDWFKDYPYAYIHGDTSPFYLCAMYDYYRMSGDLQFIKESWQSIVRAYEWSLATDGNGDGLMDNKKAGLGAMEYGPLTDIQSDIYTGAVWVRAAKAMADLARAVGDDTSATKAERYASTAAKAWDERFWDPKREHYAYAFTANGEHVDIVSPWSSVGLHWELGNPERSVKSLLELNSSELTTDWGIRSISNKSAYFEPLNYNYGAVWPFLTSWVATAQYKHGFALQGYNSLMASVRHTFDNALGSVTEVFSGVLNIWPQEAVSHQGFCTAGVVLPLVRGMLGLEADAASHTIWFSPRLPADWRSLTIRNYRVGNDFFSFEFSDNGSRKTWKVTSTAREPYTLRFRERRSPGSRVLHHQVTGDGKEVRASSEGSDLLIQCMVGKETLIELEYEGGFALLPPEITTTTGEPNKGLKIISEEWRGKSLFVETEGLAGMSYHLKFVRGEMIASVSGCIQTTDGVEIRFPTAPTRGFVRKKIEIRLK
ncbi:MAG: hypothetical protein HBSIN02_23050 [Bacteroidia bacterium]|nr:MAG: hypothetical protein HBSIN02_23050 [Bacteroidia bacterium]